MIGGRGANGGMSGPGSFWVGSEEGVFGVGIFTMKRESLGQWSGAGKVTMIRVPIQPSTPSHRFLMLRPAGSRALQTVRGYDTRRTRWVRTTIRSDRGHGIKEVPQRQTF